MQKSIDSNSSNNNNTNTNTPASQQESDGATGVAALLKAASVIESNKTPNCGGTYPSTPNDTALQTPYDELPPRASSKKDAIDLLTGIPLSWFRGERG